MTNVDISAANTQPNELADSELDAVNGGRGSLLGAALMAVIDAVFDGVVAPAIRNGGHSPLFPFI